MHHKTPLLIAGLLFTLIALFQLWRIATNAEVVVNGMLVPLWPNIVALIISGLMAIWMFVLSSCCCRCCKDKDRCMDKGDRYPADKADRYTNDKDRYQKP